MKYFVSLLFLVLSTAVNADSSGMKPGLWEVKQTKQIMDGRDMRAQMNAAQAQMQRAMAGMSPAQRKQMEAMMNRQGVRSGAGGTMRICVSPAMAAADKPIASPWSGCPPTTFNRSGNKARFEFKCVQDGRTMAGKGESTVSGDLVKTHVDMVVTDARGRHTMQNESEMRYLGADCQGVRPLDQAAGGKK